MGQWERETVLRGELDLQLVGDLFGPQLGGGQAVFWLVVRVLGAWEMAGE